ncbi:pentatricopeptide repeat-containing protein At4g02750-like isoform X2 [Mercurialis annua]|uniref:pentatricopeptide repeat-containing protein At4g02750-like isoform X2 n=1 Tax=Mercurialis annua TaxID=3986 RepID=UPI0024AE80D3|nr:pentatricopeptide repeat-containing protein At4g02750-like isoform X2 [Mercurialis annua]
MLSICHHSRLLKLSHILFLTLTKSLSTLNPNVSPLLPTSQTLPYLKPLNFKISNYMRNGLVKEAQNLFDEMPQRNTVTWNAMILVSGLVQCGDLDGAREVFDGMLLRDNVSWNSILAGYVHDGLVDEAVRIFNGIPMEMRNVISWNLVIGALLNSRQADLAKEYFRGMNARDSVSWMIMVSGFARVGRITEAREFFEEIPVKDDRVWNAMMIGYIQNQQVEMAEDLFQRMPNRDLNSWKYFINGLVSCGRVGDAVQFFMEMPQKCKNTWNTVLLGLLRIGHVKAAHLLLEKLPYHDVVSWTNVLVGYFEIGEVSNAIRLFELIPDTDTTVWNVAICGLGENDHGEQGLRYFVRMKDIGPLPDKATITSVLTICSDLPAPNLGEQIHAEVIKIGLDNITAVSNAMVTMYARCGNMPSALLEFSTMPSPNIISWNSIICGFAHHGFGKQAIEMFEQMRLADVKPNHITFMGVLSACGHAGLVDQGRYYFDYMRNNCRLQPTDGHYTCLIDLLGRFGLIDEAMTFLHQMRADGIEVPASVWGALLGACRIHKNIAVGEIAGEKLLEIEPSRSGIYLILAEMYSSIGRREDAKRISNRMKDNGVKKQPGCSWIEVNNSGHVFLSGDNSHRESNRTCCMLDLLHRDMEVMTPKSNTTFVEQHQGSESSEQQLK